VREKETNTFSVLVTKQEYDQNASLLKERKKSEARFRKNVRR
jgi:hypothetical protein